MFPWLAYFFRKWTRKTILTSVVSHWLDWIDSFHWGLARFRSKPLAITRQSYWPRQTISNMFWLLLIKETLATHISFCVWKKVFKHVYNFKTKSFYFLISFVIIYFGGDTYILLKRSSPWESLPYQPVPVTLVCNQTHWFLRGVGICLDGVGWRRNHDPWPKVIWAWGQLTNFQFATLPLHS